MNRDQLVDRLVAERFGPLTELEKERPPTPAELERRRRVLVGDDNTSTRENEWLS